MNIGSSCTDFSQKGSDITITKLVVYYTDDDFFEAGEDGYEIVVRNDFATPEMVQDMYDKLKNCTYRPFEATGAYVDPACELGDSIELCDIKSAVYSMSITASAAFTADIAAPGQADVDHEYPYEGQYSKEIKQRVKLNAPYYGVSISRKAGLEIKRSDGQSEAVFNSDVFAMRSKDKDGNMADAIYFDTESRKYRISGEVQIDGSISSDANITDALYAEQGDIAQLTVDWIDTSHKITKYLNDDTSEDHYFEGHENSIQYKTATVKMNGNTPFTEHLKNRYGDLLYWDKDISDAVINGGYPYVDDQQVYVKTEETDWPVMVYQYTVYSKMSIAIDSQGVPEIWLGAGDGVTELSSKGRIRKEPTGLELAYWKSNTGEKRYITLGDDGIIINGLSYELSALRIGEKSYSASYGGVTYDVAVTKDASGRIMSLNTGERTIPITYGEAPQ